MVARPLFSVIIPLEFHRGQAARCVSAWCDAQTLFRPLYEVVLAVPPGFASGELSSLIAKLSPHDRVIYSEASHDMVLCVEGAAAATAKYLFFTESHVWPEPDVLEKSLQVLEEHPDWSAFSLRSLRVTSNRLSEAEADMYEADIEYGMTVHPWRKILDQCFVTRREPYFESGGFEAELGHFAEWVLAARYYALGFKIGYAPEICVHHYYIGDLKQLREFTLDFMDGTTRYFSRKSNDPKQDLLDPSPEWECRSDWDQHLARRLLKIATMDYLARRFGAADVAGLDLKSLFQWLPAALAGTRFEKVNASGKLLLSYFVILYARQFGSKAWLRKAVVQYLASLAHAQQVAHISSLHALEYETSSNMSASSSHHCQWYPRAPGAYRALGFYTRELLDGVPFRWSRPVAMISLPLAADQYEIQIDCLSARPLKDRLNLRFFHNEQRIPTDVISIGEHRISLKVTMPQSGDLRLSWTCNPLQEMRGHRRFGIPVAAITWNSIRS